MPSKSSWSLLRGVSRCSSGPGRCSMHGAQPADLAGGAHDGGVGLGRDHGQRLAQRGRTPCPPAGAPARVSLPTAAAARRADARRCARGPVRPDRQGRRRHRWHPRDRPDDGPRTAAGRRPGLHQLAQGRGRRRRRRGAVRRSARCVSIPADLSTRGGVPSGWPPRSAEREDELHILVNNAGATWGEPLETFPESAWDKVLDLNLKSPFFLTRAFLPLLRGGGHRRRPGPRRQHRQHRRPARAADAHLLVLVEQGRAAPPDPRAGQGARAPAHHRQRRRARARSSRR